MPIRPALLALHKRQVAEATAEAHYFTASHAHRHRDKKYWVVNSANKRLDRPITMDEFAEYLGPKATAGVWRQYKFYPAN